MPRQRINHELQPNVFVQVNWRRHDEVPGHEPYVQLSTINEQANSIIRELLDVADVLLAQVTPASEEWRGRVDAWRDRVVTSFPELTGWYVTLNADGCAKTLRTLHRARGQAFPRMGLPTSRGAVTLNLTRSAFDKPGQLD